MRSVCGAQNVCGFAKRRIIPFFSEQTAAERWLKAHLTLISRKKTQAMSSFPMRGALSTLSISVYIVFIITGLELK